jgi:hypothetical protein
MMDDEVAQLLERAPEFGDRYRELVAWADGDPGAAAVFAELADYVAGLVAEIERSRPTLERCLAGLEEVAGRSPDAEELVVWSFFDGLSPDDVGRLHPWLGPRTRALLDEADRLASEPDGDRDRGGDHPGTGEGPC